MPHPVVYHGDLAALINKWDDQKVLDKLADTKTYIANGECAKLPQALTNVGHTSRWQPGERVVDVRNLAPGTVIANFMFEYDKMWYPNSHGYHAALFVKAEGHSVATGKPSQILMFDQWAGTQGKVPGVRPVRLYAGELASRQGMWPCDNANEFFVVMVP